VAQDAAQRERAPCEPPPGAPAARKSPGLCAFQRHDPPQGRGKNLLVLLHGLGDTAEKYLKLGEMLQLPDTSVVALEGTRPLGHGLGVEALQGEGGGGGGGGGYQWYPAFEANGDLISPDAEDERRVRGLRESADAVQRTLEELWRQEGWCARGTLLFGFSQVGSVIYIIYL
jgi:predicted esterase